VPLLLNKGDVLDGVAQSKVQKEHRFAFLQKHVMSRIQKFANIVPLFEPPTFEERTVQLPYAMSDQEYIEYSKQCFYINIVNALVLFKITEICVVWPSKVFDFSNYNSWTALLQNTSINISGKIFTAFEIRQDIIRNVTKSQPTNFCVDHRFVHPLIHYAFFLPHSGTLKLKDLCFTKVNDLISHSRNVHNKLKNHIQVVEGYGVILLPSSLKNCFTCEELKVDLDSPHGRQAQVYTILNFIHKELLLLGPRQLG
jgi:hypothetical protein